jgi:hypothetical protein
MCAPGLKVSLDKPEPNVVKKIHGSSQVAPKPMTEKAATKIISNPLAIPLKVPGMG